MKKVFILFFSLFITALNAQEITSNDQNNASRNGGYGTFYGKYTGQSGGSNNIHNVHLGWSAGRNSIGSGNVFIGNYAGYNQDVSNKLFIDNGYDGSGSSHTDYDYDNVDPLIWGDFDSDDLKFNATVSIRDLTQDALLTRVLVANTNGKVFWRDASSLGGSGGGSVQNLSWNPTLSELSITDGNTISLNDFQDIDLNSSISGTALDVTSNHTSDFKYGILSNVSRDYGKALVVRNSTLGSDVFTVYGSGKTYIKQLEVKTEHTTDFNYNIFSSVGRDNTKALTVFNRSLGTSGEEVFRVYGTGKMECRSIRVSMNIWSDHVFKKTYSLMPLSEVKSFISKEGHLPEIPTEKEIKTNGIDIGEMNRLLLQKIEELTLYVIDQNERLNKQEEYIVKLNKKLKNRNK
jgi:hypothetical protein